MNPLASTVKSKTHFTSKSTGAPTLTVSQFKVNRSAVAAKKKIEPISETLIITDPRAFHKSKLAEFARDFKDTLPKKRMELKRADLGAKQRKILEAQVRALESRRDENIYVTRVTPLLKTYEECVKASYLNGGRSSSTPRSTQHFGRVENKELKAAKDAFYMETLGYVPVTDSSAVPVNVADKVKQPVCNDCHEELLVSEGYDVCIECGSVPVNSCSDYQISYRDTQDMMVKANGSYKRSARFSEWLSSIQAKENTEIPPNVYEAIMKEIARERIEDLNLVDTAKIKEYLGKMRLTRYYDHAPRIVKYINGIPPVTIPPSIESKFNIMFNHIQEPFEIVKNAVQGRTSFLNYPYVLLKFCELIGFTGIMNPQKLKCPEKLRFQDLLWKEICDIVGWLFIPSI